MVSLTAVRQSVKRLVPASIRRRYAAKLAIAFLAVIVVVAGIGALVYLETSDSVREQTEESLQTQAELESETVGQWIGEMRGKTVLLSNAETMSSGDTIEIQSLLTSEFHGFSEDVAALHYYNSASGDVLATTGKSLTGANAREEGLPWASSNVLLQKSTATVVGPYETDDGTPALALVSDIPDSSNRGLALVLDLEAHSIGMTTPSSSETVVVDSEGTVVLDTTAETIGRQNAGPQDERGVESTAVEAGLIGKSGYLTADVDGQQMPTGYAPVEGSDWVVMSQEPASSAFALERSVTEGLAALLAAAILGLGVVGVTVGRNTARSLDVLSAKAARLEAGDLDAELGSRRVDEIGRLFDAFASMRDSLREQIEEAESSREAAEAAQLESEQLVAHLEEKADAYGDAMAATAAGDLTRRVDPESENEAMAEIGAAFNDMAAELETTVVRIQSFAEEVAGTTQEISTSTEQIRNASEQVNESIQEISAGSTRQSDDLQQVAGEMSDLSASIEEVAASAEQVATMAGRAADRGQAGSEHAGDALAELDRIVDSTGRSVEEVESLDDEIEEIGDIVDLITHIAEQTNMLALNASVEAARAGEAGAGFAVVADEIKALADETEQATQEIEELVESVQSSTAETAAEMRETGERVSEGKETVEQALEALEVIVDRVEEANDGVQEINTATDDQASSTEEAVAMVGEVASVSQQTTAEAENVSAAAEQQTASVAEVSDRVRSLASRAADLRSLLDDFDVEASDAGSSSTGDANRSRTTGSLADAGGGTAGSSRSSASPDGGGVTDGDGGFNFDRADR